MIYADCEIPQIYNERQITARKDHKCCECHNPIAQGTTYVLCSGLYDNSFFRYKQHVECRDFAAKLNIDFIGECAVLFGEVDDAMQSPNDLRYLGLSAESVLYLQKEWSRVKVLYKT